MSSRDFWTEFLKTRGVTVENTVTKRTSLLVVGDDPGETKIEKALKYGTPMLSWPMLVYLGLIEQRGQYRFKSIPQDLMQDVLMAMVQTAELLYAKAITHGSKRHYESFIRAAAAIETLLLTAWDDPRPTVEEAEHADLGNLVRSV